MDHELWWDLLVLELLKYDTDDHEILNMMWSNDETGRRYFLHPYGGDGCGFEKRSEVPDILIARVQFFVATTMARSSVKRPNQGPQVTTWRV